jgi:cytochrome b561
METTQTTTQARYTPVAQLLHWVVALLIAVQFVLARMAEQLPLGLRKLVLLAEHKSFGMTILLLAMVRVVWRRFRAPPALPTQMSRIERLLAHVSHYGLYALLFLMPLSGWMMSSAKNYSVSWFGLFTWPNLIVPNEAAFRILRGTHQALSVLLLSIVILHVLAAVKHHVVNKDDVLTRMLPRFRFRREAGNTPTVGKAS